MRFIDAYLPDRILGFGFVTTPRFSTDLTQVSSGSENANENWDDALRRFTAPKGVRCWEDLAALYKMWMVAKGRARTFPFRDPIDFASVDLPNIGEEPEVTGLDVVLGVGDGLTRDFQLGKPYEFGGETVWRDIYHPRLADTVVMLDGQDPATLGGGAGGPYTYTVSRFTGNVRFTPAPQTGLVVSAGFLFDVEARWEFDNSFDALVEGFRLAGVADLAFVEVRPCEEA